MSYKLGELGTWFIHDFETQNEEYFGSKASPHNPNNYVVATGYCIDGGDIQAHYFHCKEQSLAHDWIDKLAGCRYYVAHNATFEIHWMLKFYREQFINFIKNGGRIFCTQLAEYMLTHHTSTYPALEDCALKYGGTSKIDEVKILWEAGYLTADIDEALLMKYLADPEQGDVANTRRVCFAQYKLMQEQGMWDAFNVRMDSLLFNAVATFNGLHVDMGIAMQNMADQEKEIEELKSKILQLMPPTPPEFEFSFTSGFHMSAFMFGGTVKYRGKVSYDPIKYVKLDCYEIVDDDGNKHYVEVTDVLDVDYHNVTKFQRGKNKGLPKVFKVDSTEELLKWGDLTFTFDGLINLEELPTVVSDEFLGKRAQFRGVQELADGSPVYSTGKDALDVLAAHTEVAKPLKRLAALIKDTGTYYLQTDANGKKSGMLQFVEPNSIIHHTLNNTATSTGRLSGNKP